VPASSSAELAMPTAQPTPVSATSSAIAPVPATTPAATRLAPADPADPAVRPPVLLSEEKVPYPRRAVGARITAPVVVVVVRALVDETGRVVEAAVAQPSGQPTQYGFEEAALLRARGRTYRPARRNDVPVPIWMVVRVEFRPPPATR
jgi:TonB family protein